MKDTLFDISLDNLSGTMMLTIEPKEDVVVNEFCCEMIKKTNVYGLLKLNVTTIDGKIRFNYDLSKKRSLAEFSKAGFNESYGKRILYNLCSGFLKLNEYYLKPNYCLLNPDYTYIGDGLNVYLPYIPLKESSNDPDELKNYFSELLSKYFAVEGVSAYDEMFKYVYQCQALDLNNFISKFLSSEEANQNNFIAEKQEREMNKMPLPNQNVQASNPVQSAPINSQPKPASPIPPMPSPAKPSGFKMPGGGGLKMPGGGGFKMPGGGEMKMPGGGGFKMPGGGELKMPGAPSEAKNQAGEKKGLFGLGGKKPLEQAPPIQNPSPNVPPQQFSSPIPPVNQSPQQNFVPPRFPNGFQGSMDKTIMIDGMSPVSQASQQSFAGSAHLKYKGQDIPINDSEFVIGKANNQFKINFVINDNPHVSRKHATILMQGNNYFIRDEGSTNGTYVNGRSIPKMVPQPLQNGDEISIYDEVFIFCL